MTIVSAYWKTCSRRAFSGGKNAPPNGTAGDAGTAERLSTTVSDNGYLQKIFGGDHLAIISRARQLHRFYRIGARLKMDQDQLPHPGLRRDAPGVLGRGMVVLERRPDLEPTLA